MVKATPTEVSLDLSIASPIIYVVQIGGDQILFNKMPDLSQGPGTAGKQKIEDRVQYEKDHWREKAYSRPDGTLYVPGENVHQCMKDGAAYWGQKIPGYGNKTFTDLIKSGVVVEDLELDGATLDHLLEFGRSVNGTPTKRDPSKVYKIRPLLKPWSGTFVMHVFDMRLTPDILKTIIAYAGLYRGLCDWRPTYGRFSVRSMTVSE